MKRLFGILFLGLALLVNSTSAADPLRVFIRGGKKTHGPNAHEHERFLTDWKKLLGERGLKVDGALDWPSAEQFGQTDVLLMYAQDGGNATAEQKANLAEFTRRGGGVMVIHTAAVSDDPAWWKSVIGGSWVRGETKWKEGPMDLYYTENQRLEGAHPITRGASNFHLDDEIYYDMDISPEVRVLATSYTPKVREGKKLAENGKPSIYDIQPQMWVYEGKTEGGSRPYRAFVTIPGHLYSTFEQPNYRAILLRGLAWSGRRENVDEFCNAAEIAALTYPEGGPQRPAETRAKLEVHPDFDLKLVAAEPLISKPMNFDWDAAGRLWVAETPEYPNGRRGMRPDYRGKEWKDHGGIDSNPGAQERAAMDKISVLTDTNGDGVMDKKEVFYEGLDLVTGLVFYKDGVIVTQAPDILWLRDTNGNGKADKIEKLYTGLGSRDTHAVINNPRMGWDGWIYCTHGYSSSQDVTSGDGSKHFGVIGSGVVRFKPDGSAFEQYSSKGGNTWGLEITGDNRVMWTQPTSGTLLNQVILPEYALARGKVDNTASFFTIIGAQKSFPAMSWEQAAYVQIDRVGDFTAGAGCVVYDGGSWPAEYNGDYFVTEPTINIVAHQRLTPKGSSYVATKLPGREETEFIRSKDMWWRPIEVRVGPDGAVYVGDFYNQAVIHNDTRGPDHNGVNAAVRPDRDHYFGRIWRIDHKQARKLEVPDLSHANPAALSQALAHPSRAVRMTASQLLVETGKAPAELSALLNHANAEARIAALWTLRRLKAVEPVALEKALADSDAGVRRNAALVVEDGGAVENRVLWAGLNDAEPPVRMAVLRAMAASPLSNEGAEALVAAWPKFDDDYQTSAGIGAAASNPRAVLAAVLGAGQSKALEPLVTPLAQAVGKDPEAAAKLIEVLAGQGDGADGLKRLILQTLAKAEGAAPVMTQGVEQALAKLLGSEAGSSALALASKWDQKGVLKEAIRTQSQALLSVLQDSAIPDPKRLEAARNLLGLSGSNLEVVPAVIKILAGQSSANLQRQLIVALGETSDPGLGVALAASYGQLTADAQNAAFEVLLQREEWSLALLAAAKAKSVDVSLIGPSNVARLRTHPNKNVAKEANSMLDQLLGPTLLAKNEILAKLTPEVERPGDAAKGKEAFTSTCAICHKLGDLGADLGPALTGMGAHGPAELLVHIVDPNREVDPSFVTWNIETKNGQFHAGIIARENSSVVTLKSLAGLVEVKTSEIKSRVNTGRSLMPEGLEGLGAETLRNILSFICAGEANRFRLLDLKSAFTADTRRGIYQSPEALSESLPFKKFGLINVEGIPFSVVDPAKSLNGQNVVVLKGGPEKAFSKGLAARVEVKVGGFNANRLHLLGAVTGWGYSGRGEPSKLMKLTVVYNDQKTEELEFQNGVEFADYFGSVEVPGSKSAAGLLKAHQIRWFSKSLSRTAPIDRLILESFDGGAAPTIVAITAELADPKGAPAAAAPAPAAFVPQFSDPVPQPPATAKGPRILLVGGGSSHDFGKWYGGTDRTTLEALQPGWIDYTQNANASPEIFSKLEVLGWAANQPVSSETCAALMKFADAGRGLVLLHPGTWHAWKNFPEWNRQIVGGGARGHDKLGEFEVEVLDPTHPLMAGLPKKFKVVDELYNFVADASAVGIKVLAQATSPTSGKTFPQVWVVEHPKSRVVGITLGHDGRVHELPEYQTLLKNAFGWAAGKP